MSQYEAFVLGILTDYLNDVHLSLWDTIELDMWLRNEFTLKAA